LALLLGVSVGMVIKMRRESHAIIIAKEPAPSVLGTDISMAKLHHPVMDPNSSI